MEPSASVASNPQYPARHSSLYAVGASYGENAGPSFKNENIKQNFYSVDNRMDVCSVRPTGAAYRLMADQSATAGANVVSPMRRGPGRPRKDGTMNSPLRGRPAGPRTRGGGRARIKSQLTLSSGRNRQAGEIGYAVHRISNASSSTDSPSGRSSSPATPIFGTMSNHDVNISVENSSSSPPVASASNSQRCAFCYLTSSSRLGQGELLLHEPPPAFNLAALLQNLSSGGSKDSTAGVENSHKKDLDDSTENLNASGAELTLRINLKHSKIVRSKKKADVAHGDSDLVVEIDEIGQPDDIALADLFEPTGQCWAHHCCASWSDGVVQSDTFVLLNVQYAVVAAIAQKCAGCGRTGASITCRADGCRNKFHYPCASAYGGFQDIKTLAFLCPDHLNQAARLPDVDITCSKCETVGDLSQSLFCTICGLHYHASCLEPHVDISMIVRAGWQCPDCKTCQHCQHNSDDSLMLVCDSCDKGYHVYCMQPPMATIPKQGWKCKACRMCTDCGSRTPGSGMSSRWHRNYTVCDSCYQQRNKGLFCPLCERAYRHLKAKSMVPCSQCKKCVHVECIRKTLSPALQDTATFDDYICPHCKSGDKQSHVAYGNRHHQSLLREASMTPTSSASIDENEDAEAEMLANFMKSEIAGGDSLSDGESPFGDLDATLRDMDVDGVMHLLEHEGGADFPSDFLFTLSDKKGRDGTTAGLKKQSGLPRKRISQYKGCSSRVKSSLPGVGGRGVGDKRRNSKAGGRGGGRGSSHAALQNTLSSYNNGIGTRKKDDDEYIHTVVVSASDEFVFCQDICVICGSFGKDEEGRLIACMQCGQCYHPYCANVNVNAAVVRRGWRCLDCTVCEGCGKGDDEQQLLLCDDCDVSFHTYCLNPPLDTIPTGPWVCKWCSNCQVCGDALSPETMASKICALCDSAVTCPMCRHQYVEGDIVIACEVCEKWCHATCNGLTNEDSVDKAADKGFRCWFCRPALSAAENRTHIGHKPVDSAFHVVMDGIALTKTGWRTVQWRPQKRRLVSANTANTALDDVIDSVHALVTRGMEEQKQADDTAQDSAERSEINENDRFELGDCQMEGGMTSPSDKKRPGRQKKLLKVGIGGFVVRQTRQRPANDKADDGSEGPASEKVAGDTTTLTGDGSFAGMGTDKPKKRKRQLKKSLKVNLEDNYPSYIQEAFFGSLPEHPSSDKKDPVKAVLDDQEQPLVICRELGDDEVVVIPPAVAPDKSLITRQPTLKENQPQQQSILPCNSVSTMGSFNNSRRGSASGPQDAIGEAFDDLGEGDDIFPHPIDLHQHDFSNLIDMLMQGDMDPVGQEEGERKPSPNLENLIDSRDYVGIAEVDSAEMAQLMDNMLDDELRGGCTSEAARQVYQSQQQPQSQITSPTIVQQQLSNEYQHQRPGFAPHQTQTAGGQQQFNYGVPMVPADQHQQSVSQQHVDYIQDTSRFLTTQSVPALSPAPSSIGHEMMNPPSVGGFQSMESPKDDCGAGADPKTYFERWEPDESLGDKATIAAVLHANINYPDLRMKYPVWTDRAKQIAKLWRFLAPDSRQQYVQMARKNRAASRQTTKTKKVVPDTARPPSQQQMIYGSCQKLEKDSYSCQAVEFKPNIRQIPTESPDVSTDASSPHDSISSPFGAPMGGMYGPATPAGVVGQFKVPHTPVSAVMDPARIGVARSMSVDSVGPIPRHEGAHVLMRENSCKPEMLNTASQPAQRFALDTMHSTIPPSLYVQPMESQRMQHPVMQPYMEMERPDAPSVDQCAAMVPIGQQRWSEQPMSRPPQHSPMFPRDNVNIAGCMQRPGDGQMPPQEGLLPRDLCHEEWLFRTQQQFESQLKVVETELNQLRRNKKNMLSKQRQLKKNDMQPSPNDLNSMSKLQQNISERQKALDQLRKQVKQHNSQVQEYQAKRGMLPGPMTASTTTPAVQQPAQFHCGPGQSAARPMLSPATGHPDAQHMTYPPPPPPQGGFFDPRMQMFNRMPVPQTSAIVATNIGPRHMQDSGIIMQNYMPPQHVSMEAPHPGACPMPMDPRRDQRMPTCVGVVRHEPSLTPTQLQQFQHHQQHQQIQHQQQLQQRLSGDFDAKKKKKYNKKKMDAAESSSASQADESRSDCKEQLTSSNLLKLATSFEADVVATMCSLLDQTTLAVDGTSAATAERENTLLKNLLQHSPLSATSGDDDARKSQNGKRAMTAVSGQASPKKRQRKLGTKAKPGSNQTVVDTQAAFLEQLASRLNSLPILSIQEPAPKSDPLISINLGVTTLVHRPNKPLLVGPGVGRMQLSFMPDYYKEVFGKSSPASKTFHQQSFMVAQQLGQSSNPYLHTNLASPFSQRPQTSMVGAALPDAKPHLRQFPYPDGSGQYAVKQIEPMHLNIRTESPAEVIYSSSPEMEEDILPTYPALKPTLPAEGRLSPNFRLVAPVPMRAVPPDPPSFFEQASVSTGRGNEREEDENGVRVTLTLDGRAALRVDDVLRELATLLKVEVPKHFEIHIDTPPHTPDKNVAKEGNDHQQAVICRQCENAVQEASVRKKLAELGLTPKEDDVEEVIFCSVRCFDQFASDVNAPVNGSQGVGAKILEDTVGTEERADASTALKKASTATHISESGSAKETNGESRFDEIIKTVIGDTQTMSAFGAKEEIVHVKDLPKLKDVNSCDSDLSFATKLPIYEKRWKGTRWKPWTVEVAGKVLLSMGKDLNEIYEEMKKILFRPTTLPVDARVCDFCSMQGDGLPDTCGRLLNLDAGRWVHVNCALWSAEVYERIEGALVNVEQAVRRASGATCSHCQRFGASIPCFKLRCEKSFHLPCAVECRCTFLKDKTMLCPSHSAGTGSDVILPSLSVIRRVYVERDENRIIAKLYQQGDSGELALRVGSLIFGHVGQLLPHQLRNFHNKSYIFPVGYTANRIYWSPKNPRQRNIFTCSIGDRDNKPLFNVSYNEPTFADLTLSDVTASGAWSGILQQLEKVRVESGMLKLFSDYLRGEALFGLTESCIVKMIESLPGVDVMLMYECKYGRSPLIDLPLAVNPSGCARCEPHFRTYIKRPHTLTASSSGSLQNLLELSGMSAELALYQYVGNNRQTLVSKWSQYRKMKQEWQTGVYLARSKIQGLGLYAKRDIEMSAMVIEYIGEVIRNEVAERREKLYQAHNRGIYMFRIDAERVIDATISGGPARYVNHSCDPNCVAELFEFDREAKIIIMTCRPICKGEELTYDYQFDEEDDGNKIPCLCGAPNCKKWMN